MEHIIQFGIGIDDNAIVEKVTKNAEKVIIEDLKGDIYSNFFEMDIDFYGRNKITGIKPWVKDRLDKFFDENRDEIIKLASDKLADKLSRSKTVKEAMANGLKEG